MDMERLINKSFLLLFFKKEDFCCLKHQIEQRPEVFFFKKRNQKTFTHKVAQ